MASLAVALALAGCAAGTRPAHRARAPRTARGIVRDFALHPAVYEQACFTTLYAVSDVHGGYARLVALLARHGLVAAAPASPGAVAWTGGDATLVVTGDFVDRGPDAVAVIDLLQALAMGAAAKHGQVVVTLGNHEAEFLANAANARAREPAGFATELLAARLDPGAVARGEEPRGRWLNELPLGARIGGWFFAHAGHAKGRAVPALEQALRAALQTDGFASPEVIGPESILEARNWWEAAPGRAAHDAAALGVGHIVMGHSPHALGPPGAIAVGEGGALFRIDVGMSPLVDESAGALLRIKIEGDDDVAVELGADGGERELWRGRRAIRPFVSANQEPSCYRF